MRKDSPPPTSRSKSASASNRAFSWGWLVALILMLAAPGLALARSGIEARWLIGGAVGINLLTFGAYAHDKRQAREGAWRLPETLLHTLELIGGWPGAFLAQRWLRHKCIKVRYQIVFWLIVLTYQFAAVDSLRDWQLCRAALKQIPALKR